MLSVEKFSDFKGFMVYEKFCSNEKLILICGFVEHFVEQASIKAIEI